MNKQVIITVETTGEIRIEATGFKGSACEKATAEIEKALGVKTSGTRKPDYYQQQINTQQAGH